MNEARRQSGRHGSDAREAESATSAHEPRVPGGAALWISVALAAAVLVVYRQVVELDFVSLDDPGYIFGNPQVRGGLTWDGVRWAFTGFHKSNWHPLTWLSLMLDCELFGLAAGKSHMVNVVLHAANAVLLFLALRLMTGAVWPSALVASLFALHPLRVESVAWVTERKDVLSGLFWMLTLLAYAWYVRYPAAIRYLLVFTMLALGLMAKAVLVTLPCVLLLLDLWPLGRWQLSRGVERGDSTQGGRRPALSSRPMRRLILEKVPLLGLSAACAVITSLAQSSGGAVAQLGDVSVWSRVVNSLIAYVTYLRKTIWPVDLAVFYPHPAVVSADLAPTLIAAAIGAALVLASVSLAAMYMVRRRPYLAVGWFWYVGTLVPMIGIFQVGLQAMADRYSYVPLVGIYVAIAWGGRDIASRWSRSQPVLIVAAAASLILCVVATWFQIGTWRNSVTLFEHATRVTRDNFFAHGNLAAVLVAMGKPDAAAQHYERALDIWPDYATAHTGLGTLRYRQGRLDEAAAHHRSALRSRPDSPVVHTNLGAALLRQGKLDEAAVHLERALSSHPDYVMAHSNLGAVYFRQGKLDEAEAHFRRALQLQPGYAAARNNLAAVLLQQGKLSEAAASFEQVLRANPDNASARRSLAQIRAVLRSGVGVKPRAR